jgi:hypothetical protein
MEITNNDAIIANNSSSNRAMDFIQVPNLILRSALFGIVPKGVKKCHIEETYRGWVSESYIKYEGKPLSQDDLDVLILIIKKSHEHGGIGEVIPFDARKMLFELGRSDGTKSRQLLIDSIDRLWKANIEIYVAKENLVFKNHLVRNFVHLANENGNQKNKSSQFIQLESSLNNLIDKGWSQIFIEDRGKLNKQLTKWLHSFYSTHSKPVHLPIEIIKAFSGSKTSAHRNFIASLNESFTELKKELNWEIGFNAQVTHIMMKHPEKPLLLPKASKLKKESATVLDEPFIENMELELSVPLCGKLTPEQEDYFNRKYESKKPKVEKIKYSNWQEKAEAEARRSRARIVL